MTVCGLCLFTCFIQLASTRGDEKSKRAKMKSSPQLIMFSHGRSSLYTVGACCIGVDTPHRGKAVGVTPGVTTSPIVWRAISLTAHWSDGPSVRQPINLTAHWPASSLEPQPHRLTSHWSYGPNGLTEGRVFTNLIALYQGPEGDSIPQLQGIRDFQ